MKMGLLEMLKRFRINFKRNKIKKLKKYNKTKSIFYNSLVIFSYPLYIFFKNFKQDDAKIRISNPGIYREIDKPRNEIIKHKKPTIIKKKITKTETKVSKIKNKEDKVICQKMIEEIKNVLKSESIVAHQIKVTKEIESFKNNNCVSTQFIKKAAVQEKKVKKPKEGTNFKLIEEEKLILESNRIVDAKQVVPISSENKKSLFIYESAINIKKINDDLAKITCKLKQATYNELYDYEHKIRELESNLELLKKECKLLGISFSLVKGDLVSIEELEEKLKKVKQDISIKKDELFKHKEEKIDKKEKEEVKQEKIKKTINNYEIINEIILNDVYKQQELLKKFNKKMLVSTNKKNTLLTHLKFMSFNILSVILPFNFFKNKVLSTLTSAFLLNNNIKTMRKMINKNYYNNYELLNKEYFDRTNMLSEIDRLNYNSLLELDNLKTEILAIYSNDLDDNNVSYLLNDIALMENKLRGYETSINKNRDKLNKTYVKIKKNVS